MKLKVLIVLVALTAPVATADDTNIQEALKHQCEHHLLVLRFSFHSGDQQFDASGKSLNEARDKWKIYGPIFVRKLTIDSADIRIEGPRVAFGADKRGIELGKPVRIRIRLDHSLTSLSEAQEIISRVFFPDAGASDYPRPTFLRLDQKTPSDETIYKIGKADNVRLPIVKYSPDPDYSDEAREHKFQGTVTLSIVIDKAGTVSRITIDRAIGMGLDEKAVDKVKVWKFRPATRDGQPVATQVSVEVQFNLY